MKIYDLTKKEFHTILDDYIQEITNTKELENITIKVLSDLSMFDQVDWTKIKKFVDKQVKYQEQEQENSGW
jgi:hypothetical protein